MNTRGTEAITKNRVQAANQAIAAHAGHLYLCSHCNKYVTYRVYIVHQKQTILAQEEHKLRNELYPNAGRLNKKQKQDLLQKVTEKGMKVVRLNY